MHIHKYMHICILYIYEYICRDICREYICRSVSSFHFLPFLHTLVLKPWVGGAAPARKCALQDRVWRPMQDNVAST